MSIFEFMEIIDEIKERLLKIDLLYIFGIIYLEVLFLLGLIRKDLKI